MIKARIPETYEGIQDRLTVDMFDRFARRMRDRGLNNVGTFLAAGITGGTVLEIGPGPGYVGLSWLERSSGGMLTGIEISDEMIRLAEKNAAECGLGIRARYVKGNCMEMPFAECSFDAVISNNSLHEWESPEKVFDEIHRVLKPGGLFCMVDLRRDTGFCLKWLMYYTAKPKEIRPGFLSSLAAAYTPEELEGMMKNSRFTEFSVGKTPFALSVRGRK
jgi:ubiquinone/menaquinone biosynthesis C-methylase UbiE